MGSRAHRAAVRLLKRRDAASKPNEFGVQTLEFGGDDSKWKSGRYVERCLKRTEILGIRARCDKKQRGESQGWGLNFGKNRSLVQQGRKDASTHDEARSAKKTEMQNLKVGGRRTESSQAQQKRRNLREERSR